MYGTGVPQVWPSGAADLLDDAALPRPIGPHGRREVGVLSPAVATVEANLVTPPTAAEP